jgi:hypothetical protein
MSLHDDYARVTPFELAFPDRGRVDVLSDAVRRGLVDASSPEMFVRAPEVAVSVSDLIGPEAAAGAVHHYGLLLFHSVHFVSAGCPLYLLGAAATRTIVAAAPDSVPRPPRLAGYLQLPQHLFWLEDLAGGRPESLDGAFWTVSSGDDLHVLTISGLRPDRPGFQAVALPEAPLADAPVWMRARARDAGEDFSTSLPGGQLDELYAVATAGEVFKLVARFFAYAAGGPAVLDSATPTVSPDATSPRPSALPYTLVRSAA